jgi:AcrR family transcriptional regulator
MGAYNLFIERMVNEMMRGGEFVAGIKKQPTSRDLQAIERRNQLLEAATELFAGQGYHATPIREINRKIGMADGLLYHYFPGGKLEILQTIVSHAKDRRIDSFDIFKETLDLNGSLKDIIVPTLRFLCGMLEKEKQIFQIQVRERELLDQDVNKELESLILDRIHWLEGLLEAKAQAGEIRRMDNEMASRQLMSIWLAIAFQAMSGVNLVKGNREEYLNRMVDHLLETWKPSKDS